MRGIASLSFNWNCGMLLSINILNINYRHIESNSQAKWSTLVDWILVGILQQGPLPWKRSDGFWIFLSPKEFRLRDLNLHIKAYRSKLISKKKKMLCSFCTPKTSGIYSPVPPSYSISKKMVLPFNDIAFHDFISRRLHNNKI